MQLKFIKDNDDIIRHILSDLNLPNYSVSDLQQEAIITEYIRDCIFKSTIGTEHKDSKDFAVYSGRIRNVLLQQLGAIWPKETRLFLHNGSSKSEFGFEYLGKDSIKHKLNNLHHIGDIAYIGKGFWVPTPPRLVNIPEQKEIAFIGGWPTKYIKSIAGPISQKGLVRLVSEEELVKKTIENNSMWQPYEKWIGWVPSDLIGWTKQQIGLALRDGSSTLYGFENFDIYASFNFGRSKSTWIRIEEFSSNIQEKTVLLCRTRDKRVTYFLGIFQNGKILKEYPIIDKVVLSWLRIGLRVYHGRMNSGQWNGEKLKMYPFLPLSLERHILLFARKVKKPDEIIYYIPREYRNIVEDYFKKYGFNFIEIGG